MAKDFFFRNSIGIDFFKVMNYQHLHLVNKLILQHGMNAWKIPMLNLNINKHGNENVICRRIFINEIFI
jgi:hypothetical protein